MQMSHALEMWKSSFRYFVSLCNQCDKLPYGDQFVGRKLESWWPPRSTDQNWVFLFYPNSREAVTMQKKLPIQTLSRIIISIK